MKPYRLGIVAALFALIVTSTTHAAGRVPAFGLNDEYKWTIVAAIVLVVLQAAMILTLWIQYVRRRESEAQVRAILRQRAAAEAALIESERRYALATAAGRAGVWDWNLESNEIYVDPRLKALLGFESHEIGDSMDDWASRIHPDDRPLVQERVKGHIRGLTPAFEVEHRMVHKDGSTRWFVARGSMVHEAGQPARMVGTDTDITERKLADEALQRAQAEMERMSRLAAFGQLSASIAHEVSQPLTAIITNAHACLRWIASAPPNLGEIRASLLDVIEAGRRADQIIRRNRGLFRDHIVMKRRADANELDSVNLNDLVSEVVSLAATRLRLYGVRADLRLCHERPACLGDRVELSQLLLNLIFNSIDSMQGVTATPRVLTVSITSSERADVLVSVRDQGVGLGGVDVSQLFTTGYTTKPTGTGVGLSICKTIVEAHGGRIWAIDNEGPGATFSLTLPRASGGRKVAEDTSAHAVSAAPQ